MPPYGLGWLQPTPCAFLACSRCLWGAGKRESVRWRSFLCLFLECYRDATLSNVLVDASCTEHLLELLTTFRRMRPLVRLIVMGDSIEPDYIQRVIGAGAWGYVTQAVGQDELRMALDMVNDGSVWAPRRVLARLLDATSQFGVSVAPEVAFTERETEILALLVRAMRNREIAEELGIGETTVKAHVTRLMRKVGVKNRVELTLYGFA